MGGALGVLGRKESRGRLPIFYEIEWVLILCVWELKHRCMLFIPSPHSFCPLDVSSSLVVFMKIPLLQARFLFVKLQENKNIKKQKNPLKYSQPEIGVVLAFLYEIFQYFPHSLSLYAISIFIDAYIILIIKLNSKILDNPELFAFAFHFVQTFNV